MTKNIEFELREYQKDIIEKVLNSQQSTLIQISTGGGKTIIAKEIIKDLMYHSKSVLFVVPKLVLMDQTIKVLRELNPQIIHGKKKYNLSNKLFISTIQTISRRKSLNPDVIFIDEIHFGYDGEMIKNLKSQNPDARIIGLSATPYDRNGKLLKGFDLILDKYDMKYMIKNKFLTALISYSLVKQNLSSIKITAGDYNLKELGELACKDYLITQISSATKKYILKSKKTIVFAVNIEHTKLLQIVYKNLGFDVNILHSELSNDEIKERLKGFRKESNNPKILISVLMLTTGFDMPEVDCAVLARPTKSQNLYKQMVGRILRLNENKEKAMLLDCGNVIENLGMPLEPIKLKENKRWNQLYLCKNCGSTYFKLVKHNGILQWKCDDCKCCFPTESKDGFKCNNCNEVHSDDSLLCMEENELVLNCLCGEKTIISKEKGVQKLLLVFDDSKYLPFEEAREYVRNQRFKSVSDWYIYRRRKPKYIPNEPDVVYKDFGWINFKDWIGKDIEYDKKYLHYEEAKRLLKKLKINTKEKWIGFSQNNVEANIPQFPDQYYGNSSWVSWDDWLGMAKEKTIPKRFKNFTYKKARQRAMKLQLKSEIQWRDFYDKCYPKYDYPLQPKEIFSKDWISWNHWLGLL